MSGESEATKDRDSLVRLALNVERLLVEVAALSKKVEHLADEKIGTVEKDLTERIAKLETGLAVEVDRNSRSRSVLYGVLAAVALEALSLVGAGILLLGQVK